MRRVLWWSGCWLACAGAALAQVRLELTLEHEQYLAKEALVAGVRISNFSGQTLQFGKEPEWLKFSVEALDGFIVSKQGAPPVLGEFDVESSQTVTRRVDLAPYFDLVRPGRYSVSATVKVPAWNQELSTMPKRFDVISGSKLWEQEFGLPQQTGAGGGPPEVRKYALLQVNRPKRIDLYVKLSDATETRVYRVFRLGTFLSFAKPEPRIDRASRLHVLHQVGARSFNYCVIQPDGELSVRQTHDYTDTRPGLTMDAEGNITVTGGIRRQLPSDLPQPAPPGTASESKPTTE
jgi:hypothetical protein